MAKAAATKPTRFKGPLVVTLRGAGSGGKDFTFGSAGPVGAGSDIGLRVQVPTGQTADSLIVEKPDGTTIFRIDQNGALYPGGVSASFQQAQVSLTAANIKGMYAAPVQILAAPGAGLAIVVSQILVELVTTATQFANGGIVGFQYDSTANLAGTLVHAGSIPASVVNAAAGTTLTGLWASSGSNGLTIPSNKGIYISNQTGAFITGTGTGTVWIEYSILTLV